MPGLLEGKTALITGGASGLGRVLVEMFVDEGATVLATYHTSVREAERLSERYGPRVCFYQADAADQKCAQAAVGKALEAFGTLDIVVNNAYGAKGGDFLALSAEDVVDTMSNTFLSAFYHAQAASEVFVQKGSGTIISIGSINAERGREGSMPYCAAKAAIEGMTKTIAKELGPYGITCNVVAPGYIATDGQKNTSPLIRKMVLDECAIRKLTEPEEVGNLVLFLASDKARTITGQVYRVDCGQYI